MRRYLLVLNRDLISADQQSRPEPISYLAAQQEQEPCEVVVLTLITTRQGQVPPFMRLSTSRQIGRDPGRASLPDHDVRAAEQRMNSAVHQLDSIGCHTTGVITGQRQLVMAVRAEIHGRDYDEVILVTGRRGPWLARVLGLDPVQRLRIRLGHRLVIFRPGTAAPQPVPVS
jgi:hypothetical protein